MPFLSLWDLPSSLGPSKGDRQWLCKDSGQPSLHPQVPVQPGCSGRCARVTFSAQTRSSSSSLPPNGTTTFSQDCGLQILVQEEHMAEELKPSSRKEQVLSSWSWKTEFLSEWDCLFAMLSLRNCISIASRGDCPCRWKDRKTRKPGI